MVVVGVAVDDEVVGDVVEGVGVVAVVNHCVGRVDQTHQHEKSGGMTCSGCLLLGCLLVDSWVDIGRWRYCYCSEKLGYTIVVAAHDDFVVFVVVDVVVLVSLAYIVAVVVAAAVVVVVVVVGRS